MWSISSIIVFICGFEVDHIVDHIWTRRPHVYIFVTIAYNKKAPVRERLSEALFSRVF